MDSRALYSAPLREVRAFLEAAFGTEAFSAAADEIELVVPADEPSSGTRRDRYRAFRRSGVVEIGTSSHVLPDGWPATLCGIDARRFDDESPEIDQVSCGECRVKALAVEVAMPQGPERPAARRIEVATSQAPAARRTMTDLYVECVEKAVEIPGRWVRVRSFSSKANADVTGRCLEGGFLRVIPRDGEASIDVNGKTWLRTAAPVRYRVGEAAEGWPLDVMYESRDDPAQAS